MKSRIDHYRIIGFSWAPPEALFTVYSYAALSNSPYWVRLGASLAVWEEDVNIFHPNHVPGAWDCRIRKGAIV